MEMNGDLCAQEEKSGVRRLLDGELVEVRQQEEGLRGSWYAAVVIGVKAGRRFVEYDKLLSEDGLEKLTESVLVSRCLDGGKESHSCQPWRSAAKKSRLLLRPRPPPLPDPGSITWSRGLSVDCFSQDAWWEGVLTEGISSSSRNKRAIVWFPEEEDWEVVLLKDMRVGQQWNEKTGKWSLKGCVDIPEMMARRLVRTRSFVNKAPIRVVSRHVRRPRSIDLATTLDREEIEYLRSRYTTDRIFAYTNTQKPVKFNSTSNTSIFSEHAKSHGNDRSDFSLDVLPDCPFTRSSFGDALPTMTVKCKPGSQMLPLLSYVAPPLEKNKHAPEVNPCTEVIAESAFESGVSGQQNLRLRETEKDHYLAIGCLTSPMTSRRKDCERHKSDEHAFLETAILGRQKYFVRADESRQSMTEICRSIRQSWQKNGECQWYFRSLNGCLLGSWVSAEGMWRQIADKSICSGEGENPTMNCLKLSEFTSFPVENVRTSKQTLRFGCPGVDCAMDDQMNKMKLNIARYVHGDLRRDLGFPDAGVETSTPCAESVDFPLLLRCNRNSMAQDVVEDGCDLTKVRRWKSLLPSVKHNELRNCQGFDSSRGTMKRTDEGAAFLLTLLKPAPSRSLLVLSETITPKDNCSDVKIDVTTSQVRRTKKRARLKDIFNVEESACLSHTRNTSGTVLIYDNVPESESRSKKNRFISDEGSLPPGGKFRRSGSAILQESSRKRASTLKQGWDEKREKKSASKVRMCSFQVREGRKSRRPTFDVRLKVLLSSQGSCRDSVVEGELTRNRTLLSWLIDSGKVVEHEKVRYLHRKDLHCMLEGFVTREGILCKCCKNVVTLSEFEAHAGSKLHRPSANIFLDNGRSLSLCQVEALCVNSKKQGDSQQFHACEVSAGDQSDDVCGFCGDGGVLILCDHCPSTYHLSCMGLQEIPDGDWFCPNCRCGSCGVSQFNFDPTIFNEWTVILCQQCEIEYHVKCLRARGMKLDGFPQDDVFCGDNCKRIFLRLRNLVGVSNKMQDGFSWTLLRSVADDYNKSGCVSRTDMKAEHDRKLSMALTVMQECFRPMIDPRTNIDIISHVLYNRRSDVSRLNYQGFYTMLLERGDELISVATIRVHGSSLAEMPLIGTRLQYRRQGMCRRLMGALEEMLKIVEVQRMVLPAVPDLLDTWMSAFGFQPLDESQRLELVDMNIMAFPETSILYKWLERAEAGESKPKPLSKQPVIHIRPKVV